MKIIKPIFTLNPIAFQVYCYIWKKLELLPENAQAQRVVICSKAELTQELNHSINTIRQALDIELENSFRFIRKLPNEPDKAQNRILICEDKEWNWDLIRGLYKARTAKERRHSFDSLFDDLSISDPRSDE
jgi:hypothetical protein